MVAKLRPAAFIDRDGVINKEFGYVHRVEDFEILPGVVDGLSALQRAGFALVVVTNQAGIARGMYTAEDFHRLSDHMRSTLSAHGVELTGICFCPHHPDGRVPLLAIECTCRKPRPGMLLAAASEFGLDLAQSILIGDKLSDVEAGRAAGVALNLLVRSGHELPADSARNADQVFDDLAAAALWISRNKPIAESPRAS